MSVNPAALKLPGVQNHPKKIVPRRMTIAERIYLPLLAGMVVTIRHMFQNLLGMRKKVTIEYPEERREYSPRYRGHHILTTRPDGSVRCVACFLCATACPAECITIVGEETPVEKFGAERFKHPQVFEIDMLKCIYCGMCVEACPKDAIGMTTTYNQVGTKRSQFIFDKERLLKNNDEFMKQLGLERSGKDAKTSTYPLSPDKCGPDITHGLADFRVGTRQSGV